MHPLTFPQQAIYLDALLRGDTTKFNMGGGIVIRGPLDVARFRQGLEAALGAHDAQRMRLHRNGESAMQEFVDEDGCPCPFEMLDYSDRPAPFQAAADWVLADIGQPMRLDQSPFHGDVLFRLAEDLHLWYPKFHHIANDAFGHSLIAATAATAYNELLRCGRLPAFERHSYADFIRDDIAYASSEQFRKDEAFWRSKFASMPEPLPFTKRKGEMSGEVLRTERCTLAVNRLVYDSVTRRSEDSGVTPFQLLLACLFACLSRLSGCDDIVIGTPILNRSNHAFRRTAGMFMNMMPLRIAIDRGASVFGLADKIKAETRSCYRHQRFPVGETLRHCRTLDGFCHGVFDVTVVYRKLDYDITFGGSPIRVVTLDTGAREETLSLEIDEYNAEEDVNLFFNFNPQLISMAEAEQIARAFDALLLDIALVGDVPVGAIRLVPDLAISAVPLRPAGRSVVDMVEQRADESPEAVAVVCGDHRITRGQFDGMSSRIAAFLAGIAAPEQPVAVLCARNTEWIAALMGILKAGCAYLPLDAEMPRERLRHILKDSGCRLLLAGSGYESETFDNVDIVPVEKAARWPSARQRRTLSPDSLAYIIYTSGTTGRSKGVLIEHGSLANTIGELLRGWEVSDRDRVLEFASPMFDASIVDIFLGLASGAPLLIAPKDVILNPARFLELVRREQVTVATLPPAYLSALGTADLTPLRLLITAGEAANPVDVAHYARRLDYVNAYGPTECSVCASYYKLKAAAEFTAVRVPIGKAIGSTAIRILDENLNPVPLGAVGELCIAGAGLARGYLNRPELTAERFVLNPLCEGERLYRTGDLGRLLPDGNIEFLGRRDTQVKIRGYRVELGEIETVLKTHPSVETAVVVVGPGAELVACVIARSGFDPRELRRYAASKLPAYMVPSRWLQLDEMPLNSSGKVDRDALPDLCCADVATRRSAPPSTALERVVAEIWEDVLAVQDVGADQDFFEIGGHSLKAVRVLSRLQERLGRTVEMAQFFADPTVAGLAARIEGVATSQVAPIPVVPTRECYPLSNAQSRLWVLAQMEGGSAAYNMPLALDIRGALDVERLELAFGAAIARHESLRTCFVAEDGVPQQKVVAIGDFEFELVREELTEKAARVRIQQEFARPFDLSSAPLLRAGVFHIEDQRWLLCLVVHHLVADGWSLDVLLRELSMLYAGLVLPELPIQYRDYSQWMANHDRNADRAYWQKKLAGPLPVLNLPADSARPTTLGFAGAIDRLPLPLSTSLDLPRFCAEHRVTPFMVLLAGVFALLHRYSGAEDIVIGTPVANRDRMELENQVGLYLNTLALRVGLERAMKLSALLERVRATVIEAQEHQEYPFDSLIQDLKVRRGADRNPLFDVMALVEDAVTPEFRATGLESCEYPAPVTTSVFDLTFHFRRSGNGLALDLEYNTGLFGRDRMCRLASHLDRLIEAIVSGPDSKLEEVDILSQGERRQIFEFAEGPAMPVPVETVIDMFARQSRRTPDRTAVEFAERRLSYAEVAAASARIADRLRGEGVGAGAVVALVCERSEWVVPSVIGIMASGAACLPIDSGLPEERIRQMLDDSGCAAVVSGCPVAVTGDVWLESCAKPGDAAYVTYTSGSSGTPKGSVIEHRSLANLMSALGPCLYDALPQPATELLLTSIGFDVAMKQIFGALTGGNTLVIATDEMRHDPAALMTAIAERGIHLIDITPAHFSVLLAHGFDSVPKPSLRAVVLGSESLPSALVEGFIGNEVNRHIALYNFYGPSECTVETLYCRLDGRDLTAAGIAPIGRPLANTHVYVLDASRCLAPIGVPGEIWLGGVPVGRGYLKRPDFTASRFVDDPFHPGERMYRTGDIGRWSADGTMEFLGRADGQLKIRGYRIEPGEIEHQLIRHPAVSAAVVDTRPAPDGSSELIAYVASPSVYPSVAEVRAFLKRSLPEYMVPAAFVFLPALPLTPNGKIDRQALAGTEAAAANERYVAPRDGVEQRLVEIWESLLTARPIGIRDSFFDVGGHSLLGVRLLAEIEKRFGRRLPVSLLFEAPTIAAIASALRADVVPEASCLVGIRKTGRRPPLFFVPGATGVVSYLYPLAQHLGPEVPFFAFQAQGLDGRLEPHQSLDAMAAHYVGLLREVQPHGPYFLAGHSFGAQVAFAMAQVLLASGEEVSRLVVVDGYAPHVLATLSGEDDAALMDDIQLLTACLFQQETVLASGAITGGDRIAGIARLLEDAGLLPEGCGADYLRRLLNVYRSHTRMHLRHSAGSSIPVPLTLVRASESTTGAAGLDAGEDLGWGRYSLGSVRLHYVPGNHLTMMAPPHVVKLAEALGEAVSDAVTQNSADLNRLRVATGNSLEPSSCIAAGLTHSR